MYHVRCVGGVVILPSSTKKEEQTRQCNGTRDHLSGPDPDSDRPPGLPGSWPGASRARAVASTPSPAQGDLHLPHSDSAGRPAGYLSGGRRALRPDGPG